MSSNKVNKTKLISYKEKKGRVYIKSWDKVLKGDSLKKELLAATKAYVESSKKLKGIIGEDNIIHNTFIGMKNIEELEKSSDNENVAVKATVENCKRLTELVNLTGKLIHKHGIDIILIQNTKRQIFRAI
ncbi:hypothetical protein DICPUDRAFT_159421 [Dictyostelium purpureum]|uniref:Uncharacterized protein n=1 Tax=Dictyostelium purpureum TaxID=5786 RepID=F1A431_DICPU|nr:uncharacterized protein DICPUDRAFT_159421 [Dictyostelium purpureum]EGC29053.1 hypothetical protein DICPUDRAFT_159421 [Dictyostelium purpureum]|eukprot:XP_003294425.1 hypothetical protein DICPUDRAFT_159421 [Dictyostelium purpureum]